ncbi:MAG: hydroxymethylbilane synthase [Candidatus Protistobacter heckmanni]|nr:hydroxymethylbilane synthase [Candidatus Protistobacter heckmanni]
MTTSKTIGQASSALPLAEPERLVIASRESRLALWQANHIRDALLALYPQCRVEILGMITRGDQILDRTLSKVGGKGLFVKELETALADGRADLAVNSLKDVPMGMPEGFVLTAIGEREDPRDALVCPGFDGLAALPGGSVVGTSSLRREAMLRTRFPSLQVKPLRGNLDTRLAKLDRGEYTGIVLAAAGLKRLGLGERIRSLIEPEDSLPAPGQGALGIEIAAGRPGLAAWLAPLHHLPTALAVEAERGLARALGGSCQIPLAAYADWITPASGVSAQLRLRAAVGFPDGRRRLDAQGAAELPLDAASASAARALGERLGADLLGRGAAEIVAQLS